MAKKTKILSNGWPAGVFWRWLQRQRRLLLGCPALSASSAQAADQLAKTADKLGLNTRELAGLQLAAKLTGVETNKLNLGLQRMVRRVSEAAQGTGEAQGALRELGLDAERLNRLSPDQQFTRIAAALSQVESQSDKIRIAFKLFDSEGVDLVRTLALQEGGLREVQRRAEAYGTALSRIDAKRIEQANDAVTEAQEAFRGIGTTIAVNASASIEAFATNISNAAIEADGFKEIIGDAFKAVAVAAQVGINAIRSLRAGLAGVRAW